MSFTIIYPYVICSPLVASPPNPMLLKTGTAAVMLYP